MKKLHPHHFSMLAIGVAGLLIMADTIPNTTNAEFSSVTVTSPNTEGIEWKKSSPYRVDFVGKNIDGYKANVSLVSKSSTGIFTLASNVPVKTISEGGTSSDTGDYNIKHLLKTINMKLNTPVDVSGIAYVPTTNTLFIVHNKQNRISEINTLGQTVRSIPCVNCGDIESIALVKSEPDSAGGFTHTFMIGREDFLNNERIFEVTIPSAGKTSVNSSNYFLTGISHVDNHGFEGIAYDAAADKFYVATEQEPIKLYEVTLGKNRRAASVQICKNISFGSFIGDISDLTFASNTLFVLSEESGKLFAVDISDTSKCHLIDSNDNNKINQGDALGINLGADSKAEGVSWGANGQNLYIVGEPNYFARYRSTNITSTEEGENSAKANHVSGTVPKDIPDGEYFVNVKIIPKGNAPTLNDSSDFPVLIKGTDENVAEKLPTVEIQLPESETIWKKGKDQKVTWKRVGAPNVLVSIFLKNMETNKSYTLVLGVPNSGSAIIKSSAIAPAPAGSYTVSIGTSIGSYLMNDRSESFKIEGNKPAAGI